MYCAMEILKKIPMSIVNCNEMNLNHRWLRNRGRKTPRLNIYIPIHYHRVFLFSFPFNSQLRNSLFLYSFIKLSLKKKSNICLSKAWKNFVPLLINRNQWLWRWQRRQWKLFVLYLIFTPFIQASACFFKQTCQ